MWDLMRQYLTACILFISIIHIKASIKTDISGFIYFPAVTEDVVPVRERERKEFNSFDFSFNKFEGEVYLNGYWNITIGLLVSVKYDPAFGFINTDAVENLILNQERLLFLKVLTGAGLTFTLFSPDDIAKTEFTMEYVSNDLLKKAYVTNKIESFMINPFRKFQNSKAEDIALGFYWGNSRYRGNFDVKFDSTRVNTERFSGERKVYQGVIKDYDFERGVYFYLPDQDIKGNVEVYISVNSGEQSDLINIERSDLSANFRLLEYGRDYQLNFKNGTVTFFENTAGKTLIIHYKKEVNGITYETGDKNIGKNGILNTSDCNIENNPDLFLNAEGKRFLLLNRAGFFSPFEEKNSYKVSHSGSELSNLSITVKDINGNSIPGFSYNYDSSTGNVRVIKNTSRADIYNIYPFYDITSELYTESQPQIIDTGFIISFSYTGSTGKMMLSDIPLAGTASVYINSILTDKIKVNYSTGELLVQTEITESDLIEVIYLTDTDEEFFFTFSQRNALRPSKYFMLKDSYYFKLPVKLWENSYYDKPNHSEFLYSTGFEGDFSGLFKNKTEMSFSSDLTFSLYLPELRNITLVEDFERNKSGHNLTLDHRYYYPSDLPVIYSELENFKIGKIFYRDMNRENVFNNQLLSIFDQSLRNRDEYVNNNRIGPYSSSDGYTVNSKTGSWQRKTNSLSLIAEVELDENEAVSMILPVNKLNLSAFSSLSVLAELAEGNDELDIYIDAGKISETFQSNRGVLTELLDEGISYYLDQYGIFLKKGERDGVKTTNDIDGNGVIRTDDINFTSRFLTENGDESYRIKPGERSLFTLNIESPLKLDGAAALRITIANKKSEKNSAKLIFNQFRLLETGWYYDKSGDSIAEEIFPAEDRILSENIFSIEKKERDSKLHFNRNSERTMRVSISDNDSEFYTGKVLNPPLNTALFGKFGFFILKTDSNPLNVRLCMTNTDGEEIHLPINYNDIEENKWEEIVFENIHSRFKGSKIVSNMRFEISNTDMVKTVFFIDEFYLEDMQPSAGAGFRTSFLYSSKDLDIKAGNINIFSNPVVKFESMILSENFSEQTLMPLNNNRFVQNAFLSFSTLTFNIQINEINGLDFSRSGFNSITEKTNIKINRPLTSDIPFFFNYSYDYSDVKTDSEYKYTKSSSTDLGYRNRYISVNNGLNIKVNMQDSGRSDSDLFIKLNTLNFPLRFNVSTGLRAVNNNVKNNGNFSLDQMYYTFKEDFPLFFKDSIELLNSDKIEVTSDLLDFISGKIIYYSDARCRFSGNEDNYVNIYNAGYNLLIDFFTLENKVKLLGFEFSRKIINSNDFISDRLTWEELFNAKNNSIINNYSLFFIRPFPDRLLKEKADLTDKAAAELSIAHITGRNYFIPSVFKAGLTGNYFNRNNYISEYLISSSIDGFFDGVFNGFKYTSGYSIKGNFKIKDLQNSYGGGLDSNLKISKDNKFEFSGGFSQYSEFREKEVLVVTDLKTDLKMLFFFYTTNPFSGEYYGPEAGLLLNYTGKFYYLIEGERDFIQLPVKLYAVPQFGYRFNRNITVIGEIKLAYSYQYSSISSADEHKMSAELTVTGKLSF